VDITSKGYIQIVNNGNPDLYVAQIWKKGFKFPLDSLELDRKSNGVGITLATNGLEKRDDPNRLPLRRILVETWRVFSKREVGDLKSVNYQEVINEEMVAAYPRIYSSLGRDFDPSAKPYAPVTITPADETAWAIIMDETPFGNGAAKMLRENPEFGDRTVTSIDLFDGHSDVQFNF